MNIIENTFPYIPVTYGLYAFISIFLTIWLAKILSHHGAKFLADVFEEKPELGESTNKLLVIGFYLFNFGYACLLLEGARPNTLQGAIEMLADKLGTLLLLLGVMHFFNLFILSVVRKRIRHQQADLPPPIIPQAQLNQSQQTHPQTVA